MQCKYTFLLPAYKAKFLRNALESIKGQTFHDFRVIVSNDCSPESLKEIYDETCGNDARFTYRCNEHNIGGNSLVAHWNLLVDICDTEFLIMASDDDRYDKHFLEEIDKLSLKYPEVDLFHVRVREIDAEGNTVRKDAVYEERVNQLEFISQYEYFNHIECVANNVFRTKILKQNGGFYDFPLAWASDTATSFVMAKNGVVNTRNLLFDFRMSGLNISSFEKEKKEIMRKKFDAMLMYNKCVNKILDSISVKNEYESHLLKTIVQYHKRHVMSAACYYSVALPFHEFLAFVRKFHKMHFFDNKYQIYQLFRKRWTL